MIAVLGLKAGTVSVILRQLRPAGRRQPFTKLTVDGMGRQPKAGRQCADLVADFANGLV
jgi:hypothetical protein